MIESNLKVDIVDVDGKAFPASLRKMFEQQVARTPKVPALLFEQQTVSYQQLNEQANRVAHWLRSQGVGGDDFVAVMLERSVEMVVALIAVLKAGAAYLPIDPKLPKARVDYMLKDTKAKVMLTQSQYVELVEGKELRLLLDDPGLNLSSNPSTNPTLLAAETGRHLAYIMYTSGTTGQPKGVLLEHLAVINRLLHMQRSYSLNIGDRVMLKTPFNFDVSVREFFWTLAFGGTLVIAKPQGHKDPEYICQLLAETKTKVAHFVPSMLDVCLQHPDAHIPDTLKYVMCSGEALELHQVQEFFKQVPGARLDNLYGPTETCIEVSEFNCTHLTDHASVPIGKAISNTEMLILNEHMQLCDTGVTGELYIGGMCLARGYLNHAQLTAEKFIMNPYSSQTNNRLYGSGDYVRYLPDGNIEFVGRQDAQVSINGHRIELLEVQNSLNQMEQIQSAVVTIWDDGSGNKQIVAYLLNKTDTQLSGAALVNQVREQLRSQLPDYMVPSCLMLVKAFPLTTNGKIDKKSLPEPKFLALTDYVPPSTNIEKTLHTLWANLLKLDIEFGIEDTFINLGGHSLVAIKLVTEINHEFATTISLQEVFDFDTITKQSRLLEQKLAVNVDSGLNIARLVAVAPSNVEEFDL